MIYLYYLTEDFRRNTSLFTSHSKPGAMQVYYVTYYILLRNNPANSNNRIIPA